jgi:hypothetical protein
MEQLKLRFLKHYLIQIMLTLFLVACYGSRKMTADMTRVFEKYTDSFSIAKNDVKPTGKKISKKEYKSALMEIERSLALQPDSVALEREGAVQTDGTLTFVTKKADSFYLNPYKIKYIRKNKLESPHKVLLTR